MMTALALGDQHLWVNKLSKPLQSTAYSYTGVGCLMVLQPPQQTSIRNIAGKSGNCYDDNGQVEVQRRIGGRTLWARISPWAGMTGNKLWPVALRAGEKRFYHRLTANGWV